MKQQFIYWLAKQLAPLILKWRGNLYHYKKAIKRAERLAAGGSLSSGRGRGVRCRIYFIGGKYRVLNRKQIQYWRNATKGVKTDLSVSRMTNIQLYDTLGHVNSHPTYTQVEIKGVEIQYIRSKDLK